MPEEKAKELTLPEMEKVITALKTQVDTLTKVVKQNGESSTPSKLEERVEKLEQKIFGFAQKSK